VHDFSKVAVGIKTFLRDEHLYNAIRGVLCNMPCAQLLIADDGRMTEVKQATYENLKRMNHRVAILPFDSGFGYKSNTIARMNIRPYLLIGSDDFDFTKEAAEGIAKLQEVLDYNPEISIVSGRVNNRPYEFFLEEKDGVVHEYPVHTLGMIPWFYEVDLTVNFSLIRQTIFSEIHWDSDVKIGGGEHGAFFIDVKRAGYKVAFVPGVNIYEQNLRSSQEYRQFRARARSPERPCFERRGIKRYVLGNGSVDYGVL
jgi:hypothetical protein